MGGRYFIGASWVDALKVASQIHFVQHDRWGTCPFLRVISVPTSNWVTASQFEVACLQERTFRQGHATDIVA
jgi:hypothetical protein